MDNQLLPTTLFGERKAAVLKKLRPSHYGTLILVASEEGIANVNLYTLLK